jgi:hypothetical protein
MKHFFNKKTTTAIIVVCFILTFSVVLFAFSSGYTGATKKTTTTGCSCHNAANTADVTVTISGPDTVVINQSQQYTLTVNRSSKTGAGLDIATRNGTLSPVSANIHLANGELTHNSNIAMTNGSASVTFNYTAPANVGTDTLWATGIATNSGGTTSGDDWNWAPSKRIIVRAPIGIKPISTEVPSAYNLQQNYPNPFNPSTSIKFSLPSSSSVKLLVMDITGKVVETLVDETLTAGIYDYNLNASSYASGIYFYKLVANDFSSTKKMILVK